MSGIRDASASRLVARGSSNFTLKWQRRTTTQQRCRRLDFKAMIEIPSLIREGTRSPRGSA